MTRSQVFRTAPAAALLVALGAVIPALARDDDRYRGRNQGYGYGYGAAGPVDRAISDLQRAARGGWLDGHERKHIEHAMNDLDRFRRRWSEGRFDKGRLDSAIENMQHLVNADRVRGRDRQVLAADLAALRDFRASRGYAPRGGGYYGRPR